MGRRSAFVMLLYLAALVILAIVMTPFIPMIMSRMEVLSDRKVSEDFRRRLRCGMTEAEVLALTDPEILDGFLCEQRVPTAHDEKAVRSCTAVFAGGATLLHFDAEGRLGAYRAGDTVSVVVPPDVLPLTDLCKR